MLSTGALRPHLAGTHCTRSLSPLSAAAGVYKGLQAPSIACH